MTTDIPPQPLAEALAEYARQTRLQLVYVSGIARGQRSKGAPAGLAPDAALSRLLEETGLRFEFLNARCVRILAAPSHQPLPQHRLAQQDTREGGAPFETIDEVVISASREPASRAPVSVVVWSAESLEEQRIKDISDLANLTPGVEYDFYPDYSAGIQTNIAIRGINARDGSTTAVYLDDTPVINDRVSPIGRLYPLTFDMSQVEVLRGPQGLLMGEGAEGGAIRFVTTPPSLTNYSGLAHGEYTITEGGAPSYELGAALGGPLARDVLGFRLSGWTSRDGGYVDRIDPFTGVTVDPNANRVERDALTLAATLAPMGSVLITPSFNHQSLQVHDSSAFFTYLSDPGNGILRSGRLVEQPYSDYATRWALRTEIATGRADIAFTAAYTQRHALAIWDDSNDSLWHWPNPLGPEYPVSYADARPGPIDLDATALSYQLRLTSADNSAHVTWLAGLGYVHAVYQELQAVATPATADNGLVNGISTVDRSTIQLAGYGQVDVHLRERLTASVGARIEGNSYDSNQLAWGIAGYPPQTFRLQGSSTSVAPRASLAFQADSDHLYYVTAAKGYRAGGPNVTVGLACPMQTPTSYGPDSVWSLELGAKNRLLDGRIQIDTSIFHMIWSDMQTQVPFPDCGFGFTANAGSATSDGFDFGAQAALTDQLSVSLMAAYADAHYTQTVYLGTQVVATDGDVIGALPLVPAPWSVTAAGEYRWALANGSSLSLQARDVYHSRNPGPFTTDNPNAVVYAPERSPDPATNEVDLTASASWRQLDFAAFITNVFDAQPTLERRNRIPGDTLFYATTFRPRTVGLSVNWRFGPK